MVEVNKLCRRIYGLLLVALMCVGGLYAQPPAVEARIAGLESNADYMKLLQEDAQLKFREDSTVNAVEHLRTLLREDPANRQRYTQSILQLENRIFELRTAMGQVVGRINTIEQGWVLANLNKPGATTPERAEEQNPVKIADSLKVRNLIDNRYFRDNLAPADYAALRRAQQMEMQAVDYVNRYYANYHSISELAAAYVHADAESEAIDIYGRYTTLQGLNRVLADSLAQTWNYIFDNKSYAYGYLMDKLGNDQVLTREEERVADAARKLSSMSGTTASDAVADYFLRKRVAVDYEVSVAEVLGLDAARDSLRGVAAQLSGVDFRLPKVEVAERLFLDYDSVKFSGSPYNSRNPIPECRVHARGVIYRVLLGTFNTKRAVDTFRGVHPLCYQVNDEGKWCYYAGGFKTIAEAQRAQKQLKAWGFLRPEIIVWVDSLIRDPEAIPVSYRVEIRGAESLSDKVKRVIQQAAADLELSRVSADLFVVAAFTDKAAAEGLAEAVRQADASLQIKVAKTSE